MKRLFKFILISFSAMQCAFAVTAQTAPDARLPREDLAKRQAEYIATELALDKETAQKYVETYCSYQSELWGLGARRGQGAMRGLTTEQRLERSQKILDLRKKYYKKYSRFLTEPQIDKAFQLEKQLMNRMGRHKGAKRNHRGRPQR